MSRIDQKDSSAMLAPQPPSSPPRRRILWLLNAYDTYYGALCHLYAYDEAEACEIAIDWIARYAYLPHLEVKSYPRGFNIGRSTYLPGIEPLP